MHKVPYMKPTRHKHGSGYRTFEVGYILEMSEDNRVAKKKVLGEYSDHIYTDHIYTDYTLLLHRGKKAWSLNMDLTMDGYIRFFSHQGGLKWDNGDFATSSMGLELVTPGTESERE